MHSRRIHSRLFFLIFAMGAVGACSQSQGISTSDIQAACETSSEDFEARVDDASPSERSLNAAAALQRSRAADRIAEADSRYESLAEALGIIDDAAQTLMEADSANTDSINWDLVKLAQAAAADQCALLTRD